MLVYSCVTVLLYSHIDNLTKVYKPEEQPKLGQSKETIYQVAKSLGWTLQNGNQAEALWKYKLGVDSGSGAYQSSGSMFSKSNEAIKFSEDIKLALEDKNLDILNILQKEIKKWFSENNILY